MHHAGESILPNKVAAIVSSATAATGGGYWAGLVPPTLGGIASILGIIGVLITVTIAIMRYRREHSALQEDRKQRRERRAEEKTEAALRRKLLEQDIRDRKIKELDQENDFRAKTKKIHVDDL
jgi:hypothetical protein